MGDFQRDFTCWLHETHQSGSGKTNACIVDEKLKYKRKFAFRRRTVSPQRLSNLYLKFTQIQGVERRVDDKLNCGIPVFTKRATKPVSFCCLPKRLISQHTMGSSSEAAGPECTGELSLASVVILTTMFSFSGALAACGNVMVVLAVGRTPSLQSVSNYLIASLAVADFSAGLVVSPMWIVRILLNRWQNEAPISIITGFFTLQTIGVTTYNLLVVTMDRYFAITRGFHYANLVTPQRCAISIASIWLLSFVTPLVRVTLTETASLHKLWIIGSVLGWVFPSWVVTYCYYHIFRAARTQAKKIADKHIIDKDQAREFAKNKKAAWTMGIIVGLCYVLWTPACIVASIQNFTSNDCLKVKMNAAWFWGIGVAFISSAANPWIYAVRCREFRIAFKRLGSVFVRSWRQPRSVPDLGPSKRQRAVSDLGDRGRSFSKMTGERSRCSTMGDRCVFVSIDGAPIELVERTKSSRTLNLKITDAPVYYSDSCLHTRS